MIQKRNRGHEDSSQVGGLLAPEARVPLPKNYHRENLQMMKAREQQQQQKMNDQSQVQPDEWKMKRFASVESKVANAMGRDPPRQPYNPDAGQGQVMTKAQQMKLRMQ